MALLQLGVVPVSRLGVDVSSAALTPLGANTGVKFKNPGAVGLVVYNGSGGNVTVTPVITKKVEGQGVTHPGITQPATKTWVYGGYSLIDFNDVNGEIEVDIAPQTSVSVGLITIPNTP